MLLHAWQNFHLRVVCDFISCNLTKVNVTSSAEVSSVEVSAFSNGVTFISSIEVSAFSDEGIMVSHDIVIACPTAGCGSATGGGGGIEEEEDLSVLDESNDASTKEPRERKAAS